MPYFKYFLHVINCRRCFGDMPLLKRFIVRTTVAACTRFTFSFKLYFNVPLERETVALNCFLLSKYNFFQSLLKSFFFLSFTVNLSHCCVSCVCIIIPHDGCFNNVRRHIYCMSFKGCSFKFVVVLIFEHHFLLPLFRFLSLSWKADVIYQY